MAGMEKRVDEEKMNLIGEMRNEGIRTFLGEITDINIWEYGIWRDARQRSQYYYYWQIQFYNFIIYIGQSLFQSERSKLVTQLFLVLY